MPRKREDIYWQFADIYSDLADSLRGIGMESHALLAAYSPDRGDILDHANLIVGEHQGDKHRIAAQGRANRLGINTARAIRGQIGNREHLLFKALAGIQNRLVLGPG